MIKSFWAVAVTAVTAITILPFGATAQTPGPDYVATRFDLYTATAALWRTDGEFQSVIRLKNVLTIAPMDVRLTLYMADGTPYPLAPVHLSKSGVATVNVNRALASAPPEIASHLSESGSASFEYRYDWAGAVIGSISVLDTVRSLQYVNQFVFGNGCATCLQPKQAQQKAADAAEPNILEGLWWKYSPHSTVFIAAVNPTSQTREEQITILDEHGRVMGTRQIVLEAHASTLSVLDDLIGPGHLVGGIRITYSGDPGSLLFTDGIQDSGIGYSAQFPLLHPPTSTISSATSCTVASAGLMVGKPDPMEGFPHVVDFSLMGFARNLTDEAVTLHTVANYMDKLGPHSIRLSDRVLNAKLAHNLDLKQLVRLPFADGMVNLAFTYDAPCGALLLHTASIDKSGNYVFEVEPEGVGKKWGQLSHFWEVGAGTDTMYTVWNLSPAPEDLIVTIYFEPQGIYRYPLHLEPNASAMISMLELTRNGAPDPEGHVIPPDIRMGSLSIKNHSPDMRDGVTFVVSSGIYNPTTGTCCNNPLTCSGATGKNYISPASFTVNVGQTQDLRFYVTQDSGRATDYTASANWSSGNYSILGVSTSAVATGVAAGSTWAYATVSNIPIYVQGGVCPPAICPYASEGSDASATVTAQTPTASRIVSTMSNYALASGQSPCAPGQAGWFRQVKKAVTDQTGGDIKVAGQSLTETVTITTPNDLHISGVTTGTAPTDSNGQFQDQLWACSSVCPASTGSTHATQNITDNWNQHTYSLTPNAFVYTCKGNTINGQ